MTKLPVLPKSPRNLADLDALIDQSIGKPDMEEKRMPLQSDMADMSQPVSPAIEDDRKDEPQNETTGNQVAAPQKLERLQVKIADTVLLAMKFEALKQRRSPSAIVELALRQFLNLQDLP